MVGHYAENNLNSINNVTLISCLLLGSGTDPSCVQEAVSGGGAVEG